MGIDGEFCTVSNATKMDVYLDKKVPKLKMLKRTKLPAHIAEPIKKQNHIVQQLEDYKPTLL